MEKCNEMNEWKRKQTLFSLSIQRVVVLLSCLRLLRFLVVEMQEIGSSSPSSLLTYLYILSKLTTSHHPHNKQQNVQQTKPKFNRSTDLKKI